MIPAATAASLRFDHITTFGTFAMCGSSDVAPFGDISPTNNAARYYSYYRDVVDDRRTRHWYAASTGASALARACACAQA